MIQPKILYATMTYNALKGHRMAESEKEFKIKSLQKEISKLRLEANMRKSLSTQLSLQKKVADESKAEALAKSEELEKFHLSSQNIYHHKYMNKYLVEDKVLD